MLARPKLEVLMQNADSGREANEEGKIIAWSVADAIGARLTESDKSNRCVYQGKAAVIKSAQLGTKRIEITKRMFPELEMVLVAIETLPGHFDVYEIPRAVLDENKLSSTGWKSRDTQWAFDVKALTNGFKPTHRVRHIEYRIEMYWPVEERIRGPEYALWVHDDKVERVARIPSGSKILFYETERDYKNEGDGSKTIFAAGTLTDRLPENPRSFRDDENRVWRESRLVQLDHWVRPKDGVTIADIREILRKSSSWMMRSGPYPILPGQYRSITDRLGEQFGETTPNGPSTLHLDAIREFRNVSQKDEEESIRLQAADQIHTRKVHNQLVNQFTRYCRSAFGIEPEEETFDLLLRLPGSESVLLIEAKSACAGGVGRHQIRQAIGQLFDYRFSHWGSRSKKVQIAVLLPDRPPNDIADLLRSLDIGIIWRLGDSFAATEDVRNACNAFMKMSKI
jgi:hypothetical protein